MSYHLSRKGMAALLLLLSLSLNCCIRPEDNAINTPDDNSSPVTLPQKTGPEIYTVEIEGMKFQPDVVNAHKGDTIVWVNKDLVTHCVTEEGTKAWTSSNIPNGASWRMVVNNSSDYYCAIHQVMKGKIVVE